MLVVRGLRRCMQLATVVTMRRYCGDVEAGRWKKTSSNRRIESRHSQCSSLVCPDDDCHFHLGFEGNDACLEEEGTVGDWQDRPRDSSH